MVTWQPQSFALSSNAFGVDVWQISLLQPGNIIAHLSGLLSEDEHLRSQKMRFERDQRRFIVAHAVLRLVLSRYCCCQPKKLQFVRGIYGKPALRNDCMLHFNLSHSEERALIAISHAHEVGIDIEYMRPLEDADNIARHFFSEQEQLELLNLRPEGKLAGFYACWTRKEAYIKALGIGLTMPLNAFAVSVQPDHAPRLLKEFYRQEESIRWTFYDLQVNEKYAATLVVEGGLHTLRFWHWTHIDNGI